MYAELFGRPFPGKDKVGADAVAEFQRRAAARCWERIHKAAKSAKPDCLIWVSCYDLRDPQVAGSKMFREVDWLVNEYPNPSSLDAVRKEKGAHTRILQSLCGWGDQNDPRLIVDNPKYADVGLYGFAQANPATTLPYKGDEAPPRIRAQAAANARNIEFLRTVFHQRTPK
jgi:hypothetical protein